jgi:hypothetical protein
MNCLLGAEGDSGSSLPSIANAFLGGWQVNGITTVQSAEAFKAFNRVQFGSPNTSVTSTTFGFITSQTNSPRDIQFGLKILF